MNRILAGRYELLEPIGAGGMGQVHRARDTVLAREVAIKLLPEELLGDASRRRRFEREARTGARLSHPNIVAVLDFGTEGGCPYAAMELLAGSDLRSRLAEGELPWRDAVEIALEAARGLDAAHQEGVVHRDLKPSNLFLTRDGTVKILDFGLARLTHANHDDARDATTITELTEAGKIMGTVGYMAPEQVRGRPADPRTDLFALGCVLHEMLSGEQPFKGDSAAEIMSAILRDEPAPITRPLPRGLHEIVRRCLRKEPGDRFQTAAELAVALEAVLAAGDPEMVDGAAVALGRNRSAVGRFPRAGAWTAGVALLGLLVAFGVKVWRQPHETAAGTAQLDRHRIAVVPFENHTGDPSFDEIGRVTAERIVQELADIGELHITPIALAAAAAEASAQPADRSRSFVQRVAGTTSAGLVVTGSIYASGDGVELQAAMDDAAAGATIRSFDSLHVREGEMDSALATLGGWVFVTTMEALHPALCFGAGERIPDAEAFREFITYLPNLGITAEAGQHLHHALEIDPRFDRIRIMRAFGTWALPQPSWQGSDLMLRPLEARRTELSADQQRLVDACRWGLQGRWSSALGLYQTFAAEHPENASFEGPVVHTALFANRPRAALEAFRRFRWDPIQPSNYLKVIVFDAAQAHHRLGQHEEELATLRELWAAHPRFFDMVWLRHHEAVALAAAGRVQECETLVAQSLSEPSSWPTRHGEMMLVVARELHAHGRWEASQRMAQRALSWLENAEIPADFEPRAEEHSGGALSFLGRHDEAHELAVERLAEEPENWSRRGEVGIEAAWLNDRDTALDVSRRLAEVDEPFTMGEPSYLRAAIAVQLGDHAEAIRLLQQAVAAGFWDWNRLHLDIDFDALRDDPAFKEIIRPKD